MRREQIISSFIDQHPSLFVVDPPRRRIHHSSIRIGIPPMQRKDHLSKILSHMDMCSDISMPIYHLSYPAFLPTTNYSMPEKTSSVDFSNLGLLLAKSRNPVF